MSYDAYGELNPSGNVAMGRNDEAKGGREVSEIVWGELVPIHGEKPDWLSGDTKIKVVWSCNGVETHPFSAGSFQERYWEKQIGAIRLPADHPHYKQEKQEPPQWAVDRACDILLENTGHVYRNDVVNTFARYIAEHEEAPVDPDVAVVSGIIEAWDGLVPLESCDNFLAALAAYKATKGGEG